MKATSSRLRLVLLGAYLAVVAAATLLWAPAPVGLSFQDRLQAMLHPTLHGGDLIDAVRNVALFTGWGLIWVLSSEPARRRWWVLTAATLSGAVTSLGVELGQLFFTERTPSLVDVATNTAGAALGVLATWWFLDRLKRRVGSRSFVGAPAALFASAYGGACLGEGLVPLFRQALAPNAWGSPGRRLDAALALFAYQPGWFPLPWGDLLLFMPLGVLSVAALAEAGWDYRKAAWTVALAGMVSALGLEFVHGTLGVHIRLGAALIHGWAVILGAMLGAIGLPVFSKRLRGPQRPRWVLVGYAVVLGFWTLRPYRLALDGLSIRMKLAFPWWIPLGDARYRSDLFSVIDVFGGFLLFLPVGALLAVWPLRRRGLLSGIWPLAILAFAMEFAQFFISARTPTVTDPIVQTAAAAIGWFAMRHVGFPSYGTVLPGYEVKAVDSGHGMR